MLTYKYRVESLKANADDEGLTGYLNQLGMDGWELVSLFPMLAPSDEKEQPIIQTPLGASRRGGMIGKVGMVPILRLVFKKPE